MAKSAGQQLVEASRNIVRPGEGTLINVSTQHEVGTDGTTTVSIGFNLADAPVPDRKYAADFVTLLHQDDTVKIIFGQDKLGAKGIRSLVVVKMNSTDARAFSNSFSQMSGLSLEEIVLAVGEVHVPALRVVDVEPDQTIALSANYVGVAVSGRSACLDFYSSSPFAAANMRKLQKVAVEPVVRVDISTGCIVVLVNKLRSIEPMLPTDLFGGKNVHA